MTVATPTQLRLARAAINLTVRQVGERLKMSASNVTYIENETGNPRWDTLQRLTEFYIQRGVEFMADGWVRVLQKHPGFIQTQEEIKAEEKPRVYRGGRPKKEPQNV